MFNKNIAEPKIYVYTSDSALEIPSINSEEAKQIIADKTQKAVIYVYYYYAGQVFPHQEMQDPMAAGDEKMRKFMELLGTDVKFYKINAQKYRNTDIAAILNPNSLEYPQFYMQVDEPQKPRG